MDWYLAVMKNYTGFTGRARRKEYWMFVLIYILIALIVGAIGGILGPKIANALIMILSLVHLLPSIAVGIRRLHDTDRSGWWLLLSFVPLANIVLLVFMALEGTRGSNRFGADPKAAELPA
jgi:uncharacterized membrane protein YhaH (DUF805 family)